ncbi:reverse transcriptase domain-containing protein [Tanacetum coccineum]
MIKFPVTGGILTLRSSKIIPIECGMVSEPNDQPLPVNKVKEERVKVAINPKHPEQTVMTLTEKAKVKMCNLLQRSLDVFAWTSADLRVLPRHISESWRMYVEVAAIRQKKRGQAAERNIAINDETEEAEAEFRQMKEHIANVTHVTVKKKQEELIIYLAASKEAVSVVLMTEREARKMPVYFVSRALRGPKVNYTSMEKWPRYLVKECASRFYRGKTEEKPGDSIKEVDRSQQSGPCFSGRFEATNNKAEYEALIAGLRIAEKMGVQNLQKEGKSDKTKVTTFRHHQRNAVQKIPSRAYGFVVVGPSQANYFYEKIQEGSCCMNAGTRIRHVPKLKGLGYYWRIAKTRGYGKDNKKLDGEILSCLWATTNHGLKSSIGDTPFLMTYGTEAVIPAEIGMPTFRTAKVDVTKNDEALKINLELLEDKREQAAIREAKNKRQTENTTMPKFETQALKPGDLVIPNNRSKPHRVNYLKVGPSGKTIHSHRKTWKDRTV